MLPLRLSLEGFRSFNELDLDIPAGCVSLSGANGAGKSTVVDAIDVALFGPDGRSFDPYLAQGAGELRVELELAHAGDRYRVRRTFNGRRATLDVEVRGGPEESEWASFTQGTAADTQSWLEAELGLTRETFRASALLKQGQGGTFTEASPKDRKRILAAALALGVWDEAALAAAADRRKAESEGEGIDGRLELLRERVEAAGNPDDDVRTFTVELAGREQTLAAAKAKLSDVERRIHDAERAEAVRARAAAELELATIAYDAHLAKIENAESAARVMPAAEASLAAAEQAIELLAASRVALSIAETAAAVYAERRRSLDDHTAARVAHAGKLEALDARRRELEGAEPTRCEACGQELDPAGRKVALEALERDAAETRAALDRVIVKLGELETLPPSVDNLDELKARVRDLDDAPANLARAQATREVLARDLAFNTPENRNTLADLESTRAAKAEALATCAPTATRDELMPALAEARRELEFAQTTVDGHARNLAVARQRVEALNNDRDAMAAGLVAREKVRQRLADLEVLEQAFGRDGVPAWIVEQHALPAIEAEANRILGTLGGPVDRVELRTERELKTGGTRSDALDIVCVTRDGDRDYGTFSGGERTRVNLALRIALARLLAHRRDADVRMLAIDEPDGLDEQGMSALVDVLRDLVLRDEFTTALLASHVPALRDAFDVTIEVARDERGSTAVVA